MFFGLGGSQRAGVPPDATIGVTYAAAAAAGILLIAKAKTGEAHDIFLQGNILGITRADTLVLLAVAVPVLLRARRCSTRSSSSSRSTARRPARWATTYVLEPASSTSRSASSSPSRCSSPA